MVSCELDVKFKISEEHLSHFYVSFHLAPRKNKSSYMMYHDVLTTGPAPSRMPVLMCGVTAVDLCCVLLVLVHLRYVYVIKLNFICLRGVTAEYPTTRLHIY